MTLEQVGTAIVYAVGFFIALVLWGVVVHVTTTSYFSAKYKTLRDNQDLFKL